MNDKPEGEQPRAAPEQAKASAEAQPAERMLIEISLALAALGRCPGLQEDGAALEMERAHEIYLQARRLVRHRRGDLTPGRLDNQRRS